MESNFDQPIKVRASAMAFALWLATVVLATWNILVIRSMVFRTYVRLLPNPTGASGNAIPLINIIVILSLAIVWLGVAVGGAEYHYKRVSQPNSWKLFSRTLAVEVSILVLALFV